MQKYSKLDVIGEGAYGVVWKCKHTDTDQLVAIKKFKESEQDDENVKKTTSREIKILRILDHPNIVKLKQALRKKGIVFLIFQYCPYNLLEVIERNPYGLDPELVKQIIYQLLKAVAYMHSLNIVHRDIKPENILVNQTNKFNIKVCDFGFARELKGKEEMTDYVATRWYRAPQLLIGTEYSKPIDIWSIGCLFGELIDGAPMYPGADDFDQLYLIQKSLGYVNQNQMDFIAKNNKFHNRSVPMVEKLDSLQSRYEDKIDVKGLDLLKRLLRMSPEERITAAQALRHPYFDSLKDQNSRKNQQHQTRIISACDFTYSDKKRDLTGYIHDEQKEATISSIYASKNSKSQIKKKEQGTYNSNYLKTGVRQSNCKSMSKNIKKGREQGQMIQTMLNVKHTRGSSKTQMDFYPQITEPKQPKEVKEPKETRQHMLDMPSRMSVNKIYGSNYPKQSVRFKSISKRTAEQSEEMHDFQEYSTVYGMSGMSGMNGIMNGTNGMNTNINIGNQSPYILFGSNTRKKSKSKERQGRPNINIIINNNTWVQPGSIIINK